MMTLSRCAFVSLLLLTPAAAQDRPRIDVSPRLDRVVYGLHEGGAISALGATYRAGFDEEGASYTPILGDAAPKSFPVRFRLADVVAGGVSVPFDAEAAQARSGDRVVFERGSIVEVYDLQPRGMEQSFVLADRIEGDLVLSIAVDTELEPRATEQGFVFSNAFGSVLYGRATAIDARGRSTPAETTLEEGSLRIRVDAEFLASSVFPLTIDPTVSTLNYFDTSHSSFSPDVSFDEDTNRFLMVFERFVSSTDHDVIVSRCDAAGVVTDSTVLDASSTQYWAHPRVANQDGTNKWLVVAEVGLPTGGARTIHGRTVSPQNFAIGADVTISVAGTGDNVEPDVGGDPSASSRPFCVVWQRKTGTSDADVLARLVNPDGTLPGSTIVLESVLGTLDGEPCISRGNRFLDWNVAWSRTSGTDRGIWAAQIHFDGTITSAPTLIDGSASVGDPTASSPRSDGSWLLAYHKFNGTDTDVVGRLMSGLTTLDFENLSALAGGGLQSHDQRQPHADADDDGFAVAWQNFETSVSTIVMTTFTPVGSVLYLSEGPIQSVSTAVGNPRVSTRDSAGNQDLPGRAVILWSKTLGTGTVNIQGALYDLQDFTPFCFPGAHGVAACPCFNPPQPSRGCDNSSATGGAVLSQSGVASIAADTVAFSTNFEKATALSVVFQGSTLVPAGVAFGQGVRCVGGSLKRLYKKPATSGSIRAPEGAEPTVSARSAALGVPITAGSTRYYYVVYRDATVLGGCPSTSTFNATNAGAIIWRP